jgi:hypothetical protein
MLSKLFRFIGARFLFPNVFAALKFVITKKAALRRPFLIAILVTGLCEAKGRAGALTDIRHEPDPEEA